MADETVLLDLNSPVFQRDLFALEKREQVALLSTLKRIRAMTWRQVYADSGLRGSHPFPAGSGRAKALQPARQPSLPSGGLSRRRLALLPQLKAKTQLTV